MNRLIVFGVAVFFAIVGIALLGGETKAVAGHGCNGCAGAKCDGGDCGGCRGRCRGRCHGRARCHGRCHGRRVRCCGCDGAPAAPAAEESTEAVPPAPTT